ncbi:MAG: type II toxin-antitoxin system HicB family antitoxin [Chromatiales bacterium]|nr:type II toxin-antitoxin system HicB family antitoxin [Chromatiales bacterium]
MAPFVKTRFREGVAGQDSAHWDRCGVRASVGGSVTEAIRHGREALALHVEGLSDEGEPIPPPRSIEAIKADSDIADWRCGADIALIPLLLDRGSSRRVNISLARGLLEAIDDEARLRRMTRSAFLATAARRETEAT